MSSRQDYTHNIAAAFSLAPAPANDARQESVQSGVDGMLWYCPDTRAPLAERVGKAVSFFRTKYGAVAHTVYVAPSMLAGGAPVVIDGVSVRPSVTVLPQHFFVSAEESHD